jgi:hypothetical protein
MLVMQYNNNTPFAAFGMHFLCHCLRKIQSGSGRGRHLPIQIEAALGPPCTMTRWILDAKHPFDSVTAVSNERCGLSALNTEEEKDQMCELCLAQTNGVWCSRASCQRGSKDEQKHSGNNRRQHRVNNHFAEQLMKFPLLPLTVSSIFCAARG